MIEPGIHIPELWPNSPRVLAFALQKRKRFTKSSDTARHGDAILVKQKDMRAVWRMLCEDTHSEVDCRWQTEVGWLRQNQNCG
ncbi:hypothetical protein JCM16106_19910 [Hydrogenophilus islandicus]